MELNNYDIDVSFDVLSGMDSVTVSRDNKELTRFPCIQIEELPKHATKKRPDVVKGLLRRSDVASIVAPPKGRKSFLVGQLCQSVGNGLPFLDFPTVRGPVALFDAELRPDDLGFRHAVTGHALGYYPANIDVFPLRGTTKTIKDIYTLLAACPGRYSLVVIDCLYKLIDVESENDNAQMTKVMTMLDKIAEIHGAAVCFVHHTSKGSQIDKRTTDLGAGAGALARSVDLHFTMVELAEPNCARVATVIRSQPPIDPFAIRFEYPLWRRDDTVSPDNVAVSNRKPTLKIDDFVAQVPEEPSDLRATMDMLYKQSGVSRETIRTLQKEAEKRGLIKIIKPAKRSLPTQIKRTNNGHHGSSE